MRSGLFAVRHPDYVQQNEDDHIQIENYCESGACFQPATSL